MGLGHKILEGVATTINKLNFLKNQISNKKKSINYSVNGKRKILVISGGGFRGTYALGVLKALEEYGIDEEIDAIFGVSIGAVIGAARSAGLKAKDIYEMLSNFSLSDFYGKDILGLTGGIASSKKIAKIFNDYLPKDFEDLNKPFYAGAIDTNSAKYILFNSGNLHKAVLGSMSIPGIFPPVKYKDYSLVDGGFLNNFPVDLAKKEYPNHEIIGIALNTFHSNQNIRTALDSLRICFEIIMRSKLVENTQKVDYLFFRELTFGPLSPSKKKRKEAFDLGYKDGIAMFKKIK